jgi:hypothetical protein
VSGAVEAWPELPGNVPYGRSDRPSSLDGNAVTTRQRVTANGCEQTSAACSGQNAAKPEQRH